MLNAQVVSSLKGVPILTVRIPDPGSLAALRALVAELAGTRSRARGHPDRPGDHRAALDHPRLGRGPGATAAGLVRLRRLERTRGA